MIGMLSGDRGGEYLQEAIGKTISEVTLVVDALHFVFTDGSKIKLFDNGQSCCESRYMRTDDTLTDYAGAELLDVSLEDAPDLEAGGESHEVQFLRVKTSKGMFVMSSHNEHNGYYGGFWIVVVKE